MQIRRDSQFPLIAYFGVHLGNSHQFCLVVLDFGKSRYINGLGSNKITLVSSYFSISYALLGKFVISRSSVRLRSSAPRFLSLSKKNKKKKKMSYKTNSPDSQKPLFWTRVASLS